MSTKITALPGNDQRALELALKDIEKAHGAGAVMSLDDGAIQAVEVISTGSLKIDHALGVGGLPRGRICEIYGPESSGKTTLALHVIAEAQRQGGRAAFIDAEHALDLRYAEALGVNSHELLLSQPDNGEQALDITERLVRCGALDVVVIDSVAALTPKAEIEGEMGDSHVGLQARLMSQALRKLTGAIKNSNTVVIFINQLRMKIGISYGSPEVTTGGNALKFYATIRIDIRKVGQLKHGDVIVGNLTRVKVVKNKVAPPFKQAEFEMVFGKGIWRPAELLDLGVEAGVISKKGSWFSMGEDMLGQGKQLACIALEKDAARFQAVEAAVRAHLGLGGGVAAVATEAGAAPGSDVDGDSVAEDAVEQLTPLASGTAG